MSQVDEISQERTVDHIRTFRVTQTAQECRD